MRVTFVIIALTNDITSDIPVLPINKKKYSAFTSTISIPILRIDSSLFKTDSLHELVS